MAVVWDLVEGREELKSSLRSAVETRRLGHALLFTGEAGIGKRDLARGLAQLLVCEKQTGCGECGPCKRLEAGQSESWHEVEAENGVIKIDQIRPLRERLALANWNGARVVLIPAAEELNPQAANALLKSLEEPPEQTYFFLLTTHLSRIISTIRSRCQLVRVPANCSGKISSQRFWEDASDPELKDFFAQNINWWSDVLGGARSPEDDQWREVVRDRQGLQKCVQVWSYLLHRARRKAAGIELEEGPDQALLELLASRPLALDRTWTALLNLKSETDGQVDRLLAAECFWLGLRESWQ